jgi:DNA-binding MarR family transcriptional regulator
VPADVPLIPDEDATRLRSAVGRIGKGLRATSAGATLSPSALDVLGTVVRYGPIRLSDLASAEALNPTMLSRLAGRLEDDGLVSRRAHQGDGRSFSLEATPAGRRLHEQVLAERVEVLHHALAHLDGTQRAAIGSALAALEALGEVLRAEQQPGATARRGVQAADR